MLFYNSLKINPSHSYKCKILKSRKKVLFQLKIQIIQKVMCVCVCVFQEALWKKSQQNGLFNKP